VAHFKSFAEDGEGNINRGGTMQYVNLGKTGMKVSRLCLGMMSYGSKQWREWILEEEDARPFIERALDAGINFFDTADSYNQQKTDGGTEAIIGRWHKDTGKREKVVLATKVYGTLSSWPNDGKLSAHHIRQACEGSLRRLQTDYIDLYQMHHVDRDTSWEEIWQAMENLVRDGKVIYVGSCNFAGWHIASASSVSKQRNSMGLVSEQSPYNLTNRMVELEVIPACRAYGLGFLPYAPLAGGLLPCSIQQAD